jgi:hypothetical protein
LSQVKTATAPQAVTQPSPVAQQLSLLQTRIKDMTTQMDIVVKTMAQENATLKKQIADLTAKQQTSTQQTSKS